MNESKSKISLKWCCFVLFLTLLSCIKEQPIKEKEKLQIAFLADVHLQDIYAEFSDVDYKGVLNPETGKYNTIRTMGAQLHSTRLFNENYFALLTALEDVVERGVKIVVLPGDFTDDGQPVNIRALQKILEGYSEKHGVQFLITTGNHDPTKPFAHMAGKTDFLGENGRKQSVFSDSSFIKPLEKYDLNPEITGDIQKWGYPEILNELDDFGFYPKREFLYWETPYSSYSYDNYRFSEASEEAVLAKRTYLSPNTKSVIPDASYLVEPIDGIWFLAIDGNVYIPKETASFETQQAVDFSGASVGYNDVITHKNQLVTWVKKVSKEAKVRNKTLIAFSHYPMVEFNDGASEEMKKLFGDHKMQSHRIPNKAVAEIFADAGVQIHFGGHMHLNDTGIHTSKKGNTLFNIQVPSLAAYPSAYKILTVSSIHELQIETVTIDKVPDFDSLFTLYKKEHDYLEKIEDSLIWNEEVLQAKTYKDFTISHLKELVKKRFLIEDWPETLRKKIIGYTGKELLLKANQRPFEVLNKHLNQSKLNIKGFEAWTGFDMVLDFYRLRNGDELAFTDIGNTRLAHYKFLCQEWQTSGDEELRLWSKIVYSSFNGELSNNFTLDLNLGTIKSLESVEIPHK